MKTWMAACLRGPAAWVTFAVVIAAMFGVFHLLGWREDVAVLSGTGSPTNRDAMMVRGMLYVLAYLGTVVVGPILVIGAGVRVGLERVMKRKE